MRIRRSMEPDSGMLMVVVPIYETANEDPRITQGSKALRKRRRPYLFNIYLIVLKRRSEVSLISDNSESWFKTLEHARDFMDRFVHAYNTEHRHS